MVSGIILAAAVAVALGTAVSRYLLARMPVWSEPVVSLLVLLSVCLAVGPGLEEKIHVGIELLSSRVSERHKVTLSQFVAGLQCLLGAALVGSGSVHAWQLQRIGLTDYAGIPQWLLAITGSVLGITLILFSGRRLLRVRPLISVSAEVGAAARPAASVANAQAGLRSESKSLG